ncbi:four helix bundle protein [Salegentibacter salegens]|uniref:Four helix bundle protein n=1 Tax=Salegentibacter salegens TaxID=143223 RepID=A0A1M7MJU6_9FLAO|nr:four helix bundle protein [Salegentibacter salegens]PRX48168.1 four helix bundle protein [Salegentibacter salegens]SHM91201.1 four helix bundle protein [Salegentibacter salegens]
MRNYKNYSVWKKGHKLTLDVYQIVANYPKEELYSLVSQMKRSSSSIPTNIAEGCGRKSEKDFARFLYIAFGSANELEYQILLSTDLNFITEEQGKPLMFQVEEIKKMLNSLIQKLN